MSDKIGSLILSIEGTELTTEDREILKHPIVGGVILFARNYASREQLKQLCNSIHTLREPPLLVMVDQEGGRVQRFIKEFTRLPQMAVLGSIHDADPVKARQLAQDCGWLMAIELLSAGVDLSLAPVLDLNKQINSAIGDRAFHANPQTVIHLASAFMQGMHEAGMASTGKHFPGHGSVATDSHVAIPVDNRSMSELEAEDLVPFAGLLKSGITAIMSAHIIYPQIDKLPVGFSRFWLKEILRTRMGFTGVIFSDDLNMKGANISANYADRVSAARDAGCDFALLCNNRNGVIQVLDHLPADRHRISKEKWGMLRGDLSHSDKSYTQNQRWQVTNHFLNYIEQS